MNEKELESIIEGILFVSNEPIDIKSLAEALNRTIVETNTIMQEMMKRYLEDENRGIKVVQVEDKYNLVTKESIFEYITKVHSHISKAKITPSMLETLAIIAYKQPITKPEIEKIRGVKSDHLVNKLIEYELIRELGRSQKIGKPILFGTTDKFLMYFGIETLDELPNLKEEEKNDGEHSEQV